MCHFHLYRKLLADKSYHYQQDLIKALGICDGEASLSRLQAIRSTLLEVKSKLNHEQSPDLNAVIEKAIKKLEVTS